MNRRLRVALWIAGLSLAGPRPLHAQYMDLETRDLRLIYRDIVHSPFAPYTARCFENSMRLYRRVFHYAPDEKVTVMLEDAYDFNNGAAFAAPRNTILVHIAPANMAYETLPSNERMNHTMNHEVCHIVALDQAAPSDRFFRTLFAGKVSATPEQPETILYEYLTHPRFAAPRWYHEGIASFLETWMAGGIGRAQGAYDEMVFRSMVRDGSYFYDPLGLESEGTKVEFQVGATAYLYGTRFMTYLAHAYAPESLVTWVSRGRKSRAYYAAEFQQVFGMPIDAAWQQWIRWEHQFQQANLDSIRLHPRTPSRDLSPHALGSISRLYLDPGRRKLYAGLAAPGVIGHIAAISLDDGSAEKICDVKGAALYFVCSLAYDPETKTLFYTGDNAEWRDLWMVDPVAKKPKRLIEDARIGDLVFDPVDRCLWGVRHFNGLSTLVRIPSPYREWNQVHSWPYGQDIYDLDVSPDGKWLSCSMSEISGRQSLRLMETEALFRGEATARELYDFGATAPANFVFSPNGRFLYGSSYYSGVSNIWRYDLAADSMQAVSNCETGLFRPLPLSGDSLIVCRYTGEGFVPALIEARPLNDLSAVTFLGQRVAEEHPSVKGWNAGSPASVDLDSLTVYSGRYRSVKSMGLESVHPVVQGYKDFSAVGVRANLSDPGLWNAADVTLSYTPARQLGAKERLHASVNFRRLGWKTGFALNGADFYDLVGPTKTSRKGYALGLRYGRKLIYDRPKNLDLTLATTGYADLERLPGAQNVVASFDKLWASRAELRCQNLRRSLGGVDDEKGYRWQAVIANNVVNRHAFPSALGSLDCGFPVPLRHSSLWLRSSAGYSPGARREPFANFFLGGFGNNWVDHQDEKRYRDSESFPGVELNAIGGTNFAKSMLEWNLPPLRFRRLGTPAFFATWVRTALFTTGIVTNMDSEAERRTLGNVGAQADLRFGLLSRLNMTFSLGYAAAFEKHQRRTGELMVSLKVL